MIFMAKMNILILVNLRKKFHLHRHIILDLISRKLAGEISKYGRQLKNEKKWKKVTKKRFGKKKNIIYRNAFTATELNC